ncbi:MAG: hypothetical protein ACHQRM_11825 [Bacteroidia bacterium]
MKLKQGLEAFKQKIKKISLWTWFALFSFFFIANNYSNLIFWKYWKTPFISDASSYYSYLPSAFIYHTKHFQGLQDYWIIPAPNGDGAPKMTMGVAVMETPFFLLGDWIANHNDYEPNGFTPPYIWCIYFGMIFYVLAGLWYLYRMLILYFHPLASILTVFAIFYATNLLFYTVSMGQMAHAYAFTLFCFFLFNAVKWHRDKRPANLYLCAFIGGLIFLVRPPDVIIFIVLPFLGVLNGETLLSTMSSFWSARKKVIFAALLFLLTICPQFIYWKINTGQFYFDAYKGEHFFWTDPQLINFFFSYRKGFFLYSPVMILAFLGFIPLYRKYKHLFWPAFLFTLLNIYIITCWWDWTYSGSFGSRALVDSFGLLAIPLCALIQALILGFKNKWLKVSSALVTCVLLYLCFSLNLSMTKAFNSGHIHYSDMSKEAYWMIFNKETFTKEETAKIMKAFKPLPSKQMLGGKRDDK